MFALLLCVVGIIISGGGFPNDSYLGVPVIYMILGSLLFSYIYYFVTRRESLIFDSAGKALLALESWGLLCVLLSFLGVNRLFQTDLSYEYSFIPRQAVYLFVLPAVILLRDDFYFKKTEQFLRQYGEVFFWVLYVAEMIYCNGIVLTTMATGLLCWLSMQLDTNQRWRRWIRIMALMIPPAPSFAGGDSTLLFIRILFFGVCVIPKRWLRLGLCIMAVGVLVVVTSCFIIPIAMRDDFFSDWNIAWRVRTWGDVENTLADTKYLGTGYGTSYPSKTYAEESRQRRETQYKAGDGYTQYERTFVTAPHNSFMSLTMRTGVIGLFFFILFLFLLFWNIIKYKSPPSRSAAFALFAGIAMIMFNVGLENPGYLLTFTFLIGACAREGKKQKEQNRLLREQEEMIYNMTAEKAETVMC